MNKMNRNLMVAFLLLLTITSVKAQMLEDEGTSFKRFTITPRVGAVLSNWTKGSHVVFLAPDNETEVKSRYQSGFMGGFDLEYRFTPEIGVSVGAAYAKQGLRYASFESADDESKSMYTGYSNIHCDLHYLQVPVLLHAYVTNGLSLELGLQPAFLLKGNVAWTEQSVLKDKDGGSTYGDSESHNETFDAKKFDLSLPVGISYEYMNVVLDFRYYLGLVNVDNMDDIHCKSKAFSLTVGYRFKW